MFDKIIKIVLTFCQLVSTTLSESKDWLETNDITPYQLRQLIQVSSLYRKLSQILRGDYRGVRQ